MPPEPGEDFDPTDIDGLRLWLDAADEDTIEHTAGAVSKWTSKDSNEREFVQTSGSLQPTTGSTTLNDLNTLDFSADYLTSADPSSAWKFLHDGAKWAAFAVVKYGNTASPDASYALIGTGGSSSGSVGFEFARFDDRSFIAAPASEVMRSAIFRGVGSTFVARLDSADGFLPANEYVLVSGGADPTNATASNRMSHAVNGTVSANNSSTGAVSSSNATYTLQVGASGNNVLPLTGQIAELLVYERDMSAQEIEDVTEYLTEKWGIDLE